MGQGGGVCSLPAHPAPETSSPFQVTAQAPAHTQPCGVSSLPRNRAPSLLTIPGQTCPSRPLNIHLDLPPAPSSLPLKKIIFANKIPLDMLNQTGYNSNKDNFHFHGILLKNFFYYLK